MHLVRLLHCIPGERVQYRKSFLISVTPRLPACLQIDVSYNLPDPVSKPAFHLKVDLKEPYQERHLQPPSSTSSSSSSSSSSPRHPSSRPRSRADNRSELNRKRRAPIDDDDPAAHQDKMDFQISLEVCARLAKNYQYKKRPCVL